MSERQDVWDIKCAIVKDRLTGRIILMIIPEDGAKAEDYTIEYAYGMQTINKVTTGFGYDTESGKLVQCHFMPIKEN